MSDFSDFLAAAEAGAASIYHQVLSTGASIDHWTSSPAVQPLVAVGVTTANSLLERIGIPASLLSVIDSDIHTALKALVAVDPTVPSIGGLAGLGAEIAAAIVPAAAPIAAGAALVVDTGESLAQTIAGLHEDHPAALS